jgi:hypothetical protein
MSPVNPLEFMDHERSLAIVEQLDEDAKVALHEFIWT